jgi:uncharacterized protein DUF6220
MRSVARTIHLIVACLFVAALFVQVFLAGLGVFSPTAGFTTHAGVGYSLSLLPIVLVVVGLLGGLGRRLALLAVLEFALFILQSVFVAMRTSAPEIAALHPVNGFVILLIALLIARESWAARALESATAGQ